MKSKHFFVIGNGGGGTSLLRGLLNAHSKIQCGFELWDKTVRDCELHLAHWRESAAKAEQINMIWANKIPFEQFETRGWQDSDIVKIADEYRVIWIVRRFSKYYKDRGKLGYYQDNWNRAQKTYWRIREAYPKRIIQAAFEDLVLRTVAELKRMCAFIGVQFEPKMLTGTLDTGTHQYNQSGINPEKA